MLTLPRLVLVLTVLFALAPGRAFSGPTEDASALFAKWKIGFDANDNVAIGKLTPRMRSYTARGAGL